MNFILLLGLLSPLRAQDLSCASPFKNSSHALVAILDTGMDRTHRYLKESVASEFSGWNYVDESPDVADQLGHGTHVAALVKSNALADTEFRNLPAEFDVKFVPFKYYDASSSPRSAGQNFLKALEAAVQLPVDVIQISGGGYLPDPKELQLLRRAQQKKIWVVAASGNKNPGAQDRAFFPGAYFLDHVLSVAAVTAARHLLPTSNLNVGVNYYEQGEDIVSALPHNRFGKLTGSSQAAAVFSGKFLRRLYENWKECTHRHVGD